VAAHCRAAPDLHDPRSVVTVVTDSARSCLSRDCNLELPQRKALFHAPLRLSALVSFVLSSFSTRVVFFIHHFLFFTRLARLPGAAVPLCERAYWLNRPTLFPHRERRNSAYYNLHRSPCPGQRHSSLNTKGRALREQARKLSMSPGLSSLCALQSSSLQAS